MLQFEYSSEIQAPAAIVWQFHERPDILQLLTPPWQPVEVIRREGGLEVGAVSELSINLGAWAIRWVAKHTECERDRFFTDVQTEGPLAAWTHRHLFTPLGSEQMRLTDAIVYELPGGELTEGLLGWWGNARLEDMFRYRHEVTKRECERV